MSAAPKPNTLPRREVTTFRALSTVPWVRRVMARHWGQEIKSLVSDTRDGLAHNDLNADGALADIMAIIDKANAMYRLLSPGGRTDAPNYRRDSPFPVFGSTSHGDGADSDH